VLSVDTTVNPLAGSQGNLGVARVPPATGLFAPMWTTERAFPATGGASMTLYLAADNLYDTGSHNCSGTLTVEMFTGELL
jgi:hypothetical protein